MYKTTIFAFSNFVYLYVDCFVNLRSIVCVFEKRFVKLPVYLPNILQMVVNWQMVCAVMSWLEVYKRFCKSAKRVVCLHNVLYICKMFCRFVNGFGSLRDILCICGAKTFPFENFCKFTKLFIKQSVLQI